MLLFSLTMLYLDLYLVFESDITFPSPQLTKYLLTVFGHFTATSGCHLADWNILLSLPGYNESEIKFMDPLLYQEAMLKHFLHYLD